MSESSSQQPAAGPPGSSLRRHPVAPEGPLPTGSSIASGTSGSKATPSAGLPLGDSQQTVISSRPPTPNLHLGGGLTGEAASQWEGEQLGQFVLQKFVGGGGMGIVYRALDTTLDREVAVKVLSRDQSTDDETLRRFRNEAQSAARLNHENIARVFYVGEDRGVHYIVFEFIEGVNIRDLVEQQGPLPIGQALSYCYQIALALDHACQRSVIHRDIKPSNVLITPDGKAKLVDMGLARLNLMAQATDDLTASGVTLGTFDYISPEQARDPRSADVRSDLYSLGCSFYFMLTGRPPFPDGTVLQKLLQHQGDSPPDPRTLRPELPGQASRILAKLLAKNPADRYQQPGDLIEDLILLGQSLGVPLGDAPPPRMALRPVQPAARWRQHLPWAVPIAALFLIVLGLDYYWSRGPQDRGPDWSVRPPVNSSQAAAGPTTPPIEVADRPAQDTPPANRGAQAPPASVPPTSGNSEAVRDRSGVTPVDVTPSDMDVPASKAEGAGSDPFGVFDFVERFQAKVRDEQERLRKRGASDEVDLSGGEVEPRPNPAPTKPASESVLTVGDDRLPNNYTSLLAACSAAKDGDTIELHYDGLRSVERPLAISNIKLTIRAGQNYRPVVAFAPEPDKPYERTQMVSVSGGQLSVQGVHWELELPPNSPNERSLFETQHADLLEFEDCTFTIRGRPPYYGSVAFFDIKAPPGAASMDMGGGAMDGHVVNVHLENCVARGEASLLRDADLQALRFTWNDGLLAVSERLLVTEGSSLQSKQEARAEVNLRHVTVLAAAGLVLMTNSQEEPYQMVVDLRAHDCILASPNSATLIEQRGSAGIEDFLARFQWSGDSNYFRGFDVYWKVMNSAGLAGSRQLDFDQWRERWQFTSRNQFSGPEAVTWASAPPGDRPYHALLASDFVLDATAASAATRGASDGRDAGAPLPFLPVLIDRPAAPEPADPGPRVPPPFGPPMPQGMDD